MILEADMTQPFSGLDASSTSHSKLFFGPVYPEFSSAQLKKLYNDLQEDARLAPLAGSVATIPDIWPALLATCPDLARLKGEEQLKQLHEALKTGHFPTDTRLKNAVLAPLTFLSQLIDYIKHYQEAWTAPRPGLDYSEYNVQGFCIGFLAAATVASSKDLEELQHSASAALRLAVCIGFIVDRDEVSQPDRLNQSSCYGVRWRSEADKLFLIEITDSNPGVSF